MKKNNQARKPPTPIATVHAFAALVGRRTSQAPSSVQARERKFPRAMRGRDACERENDGRRSEESSERERE